MFFLKIGKSSSFSDELLLPCMTNLKKEHFYCIVLAHVSLNRYFFLCKNDGSPKISQLADLELVWPAKTL